jgi:hypothetical protein
MGTSQSSVATGFKRVPSSSNLSPYREVITRNASGFLTTATQITSLPGPVVLQEKFSNVYSDINII